MALGLTAAVIAVTGCATAPPDAPLRERATNCLHRGVRYPENPAVRAEGIEAAAEVLGKPAAGLIREGVRDEHPGVRFAACMALGKVADRDSTEAIRPLLNDQYASVRVGAYYALDRMGEFDYRRAWVEVMRNDPSPEVRRNAAMALGLLGDAKVIPLLKRLAIEDADDGVRLQALEAMALLGDLDAESRFIRDAFGGLGYRQPFALLVLGQARGSDVVSVLNSRMQNSPYLEAKLAAARGLAMHGRREGFDLALRSLNWNSPQRNLPDDPPENQIMRVRSMAAMALGDMHDRRALPALNQMMENADDPRVQLTAARAILMILNRPEVIMQPASAPA